MNPGHLLWILFGPGTWGAGGNMVAWAICGGIGFTWLHLKGRARHAERLAQDALHHKEMKAQADAHHAELVRQLGVHCTDLRQHVTAAAGGSPIEKMSDAEFERQLRLLMRRNPKVLEAFLRAAERRNRPQGFAWGGERM